MENDRKTIEKLISSNQGFVISLASQYKHRGLEMDDLVSEGNIGMLSAARSFDASLGKSFVTYAAPFVRAAIGRQRGEKSRQVHPRRRRARPGKATAKRAAF